LDETNSHSAIRFGLGRFNQKEEIEFCINKIKNTIQSISEIKI